MKPHVLSLIVLLAFGTWSGSYAQQKQTSDPLKGDLVDTQGKPVSFATVSLLKAKDSSLVKGCISDATGHFDLGTVPEGEYLIAASEIGYQKTYDGPIQIGHSAAIQSRRLVLAANNHTLNTVQVTSSKPFIQQEVDKTVVNVANSIVGAGSTAMEVLEKSPGVTVDQNGTISLNGKSGVLVMLDGKPTYMSQQQLATMLRSMGSDNIEKIEIMTQPSAKYDAAGTAGVINIVLKKNHQFGLNGSLTAGMSQGIKSHSNAGFNLNYRVGQVNLFGSYTFDHSTWYNTNHITRNFYDGTNKSLSSNFDQFAQMSTPNSNHSFKLGMDWDVNTSNTVGFLVNGMANPAHNSVHNASTITDAQGQTQSYTLTDNTNDTYWGSMTYDINYTHKFDSSGQQLTAELDYAPFHSSNHQSFLTQYFAQMGGNLDSTQIRHGEQPSTVDIRSAKADYTLPLKHQDKFEAGLKSSFVSTDNDVEYTQWENNTWVKDLSTSNHFKYTETIQAAYANYSRSFSHGISLQLGLRSEWTQSKGDQISIDSSFSRSYVQLFPSVFAKKDLNKDNSLSFSYSRRIDRPDYQDLNPFRYYLDPYTYQEGNPYLQPQLTQSFELTHSWKGILMTSLSYSHTAQAMTDVLKQVDSLKITYQTRENLATLNNLGLNINANIPITKWWNSSDNLNVFYNQYKGEYLGGALNFGKTSFQINSTNVFILPKGFKAELSGFYQSGFVYGIIYGDPMYMASAGIQKSLFHGKGNLKFNVQDLFNTHHFGGQVRYQNLDVRIQNHWDSQRAGLTFTYSFSKGSIKPQHHTPSGILEEQSRIKK